MREPRSLGASGPVAVRHKLRRLVNVKGSRRVKTR